MQLNHHWLVRANEKYFMLDAAHGEPPRTAFFRHHGQQAAAALERRTYRNVALETDFPATEYDARQAQIRQRNAQACKAIGTHF